jgi:hypothetical protein
MPSPRFSSGVLSVSKRIKVKAATAVGKNALAAALEAGTPVEGLSGYVSAKHEDAPIFVKVTCRGLVAGEDSCGIKVLVEVQSSKSQMRISPCQFFDSLDRVKTYQAVLQRFDKAYSDYESITASRYLVNRREAVEEYVSHLGDDHQRAFWQEVQERYRGTSAGKLPVIPSGDLRDLVTTLVLEANQLTAADVAEHGLRDGHWRW